MSSYFDENTPDIVLKSLFQKYDKDNSGQLSMKEIPELLRNDFGILCTNNGQNHSYYNIK